MADGQGGGCHSRWIGDRQGRYSCPPCCHHSVIRAGTADCRHLNNGLYSLQPTALLARDLFTSTGELRCSMTTKSSLSAFQPVQSASLADSVLAQMRRAIINHELPPE